MNPAVTFTSLERHHDELARLFDSHQRALLASDIDLALAALSKLRSELESHIEFEEHRVINVYADHSAETPGATIAIFQAEHRKLLDRIADLQRKTELLWSASDLPGEILQLLSDEVAFKTLFQHHMAREQKYLFPRLDKCTTEEERATWLKED